MGKRRHPLLFQNEKKRKLESSENRSLWMSGFNPITWLSVVWVICGSLLKCSTARRRLDSKLSPSTRNPAKTDFAWVMAELFYGRTFSVAWKASKRERVAPPWTGTIYISAIFTPTAAMVNIWMMKDVGLAPGRRILIMRGMSPAWIFSACLITIGKWEKRTGSS